MFAENSHVLNEQKTLMLYEFTKNHPCTNYYCDLVVSMRSRYCTVSFWQILNSYIRVFHPNSIKQGNFVADFATVHDYFLVNSGFSTYFNRRKKIFFLLFTKHLQYMRVFYNLPEQNNDNKVATKIKYAVGYPSPSHENISEESGG